LTQYSLGVASTYHLADVHPLLVGVVKRAIQITNQDFCVETGVRSDEDQLDCWKRHTSKLNGILVGEVVCGIAGTGKGPHQKKADGFGHAVDLVPWVDGKIMWGVRPQLSDAEQWSRVYLVATAMQQAAVEKSVNIRWGGVWDRTLNDLQMGAARLAFEVQEYKKRHAGDDFLDGPHYEVQL
jgi:peptidoglycan L-alanyl-D-glutamate endopeptidase CwlK